MRYFQRMILAAFALLLLGGDARAWGDLGHRVICEMAFRLMQPGTQAEINRLIALDPEFKTFKDSCIFPDHPRIRPPEHFINLPRDAAGLTSDMCPKADQCVLTAILSDTKIVSSKNERDEDRLLALKSLGHWVGDVHQPLHVSFLDDFGGNTISVSGQCRGKLHATWDTCLVQYAVGPDASEAATDLLAAITPEMRSIGLPSEPRDWANETFAVAKAVQTGYCVMQGASCAPSVTSLVITRAYLDANEPVVKQQMQKAAVRLSQLLDRAFQN